MAVSDIVVDSDFTPTLTTTAVIPVLNGVVTGTGNATAGMTTLADLATYFNVTSGGPITGSTITYTVKVIGTTAIATPSALIATTGQLFASTVSGATLMGFGTTGDVTLKNRAGTDVLIVLSNTTTVSFAGQTTQADAWVLTGSAATPSASVRCIHAAGSSSNLGYAVPTGGSHTLQVAGANIARLGAVGFATTGALMIGTAATATLGLATQSAASVKAVTAIANGVATAVLTVTIPNAAHSATVRVTIVGSLGAGGAIGANEATGTVSYDIAVARTAGVNAVVTFSVADGSAMANVAGAATITVTAAASAISGAVGATNTFTVNATITAGSGSSTNHTALVRYEVLNANATGVTAA